MVCIACGKNFYSFAGKMIKKIKQWFAPKRANLNSPRSQAGYTKWLSGHHPSYQEPAQPNELNGPKGPEPTRYRTWERGGIDVDF